MLLETSTGEEIRNGLENPDYTLFEQFQKFINAFLNTIEEPQILQKRW